MIGVPSGRLMMLLIQGVPKGLIWLLWDSGRPLECRALLGVEAKYVLRILKLCS